MLIVTVIIGIHEDTWIIGFYGVTNLHACKDSMDFVKYKTKIENILNTQDMNVDLNGYISILLFTIIIRPTDIMVMIDDGLMMIFQ
jgi:hypothetical protein